MSMFDPQSRNALAAFLASEKDTRPYSETYQRGLFAPLGVNGYTGQAEAAIPSMLGGGGWGTLHDIMQGRSVTKDEIDSAAMELGGAAQTGGMAMPKPRGAIGSGAMREANPINIEIAGGARINDYPAIPAVRLGGKTYVADNHADAMAKAFADVNLPASEWNKWSSYGGAGGRNDGYTTAGGKFVTKGEASDLIKVGQNGLLDSKVLSLWKAENGLPSNDAILAEKLNGLYSNPKEGIAANSLMQGAKNESQGIRAYHASPHEFDAFDFSKIGTGEGAQAYGHGGYFSENPAVSGKDGSYYKQFEGSHGKAHAYEVNIKADPNDFLDWDKPLSQQSEKVRGALGWRGDAAAAAEADRMAKQIESLNKIIDSGGLKADAAIKQKNALLSEYDKIDPTASAWWKADAGDHVARPEAAKRLREAGIPGIKYLDQGSRTAGQGSRNYVVFDEKLIEIARKYGIPLGALGLGAGGLFDTKNEQ